MGKLQSDPLESKMNFTNILFHNETLLKKFIKSSFIFFAFVLFQACKPNPNNMDITTCSKTTCPKDGLLKTEIKNDQLIINFISGNKPDSLDLGEGLYASSNGPYSPPPVAITLFDGKKVILNGDRKLQDEQILYVFLLSPDVTINLIQSIQLSIKSYSNLNLNFNSLNKTSFQLEPTIDQYQRTSNYSQNKSSLFGKSMFFNKLFFQNVYACNCNIDGSIFSYKYPGTLLNINLTPTK